MLSVMHALGEQDFLTLPILILPVQVVKGMNQVKKIHKISIEILFIINKYLKPGLLKVLKKTISASILLIATWKNTFGTPKQEVFTNG